MKNVILVLILGMVFISCNEVPTPEVKSQTAEAKSQDPADCDDKVSELGKKDPAEISLDAPADEGCTLE